MIFRKEFAAFLYVLLHFSDYKPFDISNNLLLYFLIFSKKKGSKSVFNRNKVKSK